MELSNSIDRPLALSARRSRARLGVIAAVMALIAVFFGQFMGASPASAATFSIEIAYDGTGQGTAAGCSITGPGGDNTANDGVVCTNDLIAYSWGYSINPGEHGRIKYEQQLPAGVSWQGNNLTLCNPATTYNDFTVVSFTIVGSTMTCIVDFAEGNARSGAFTMIAVVSPNLPDGYQVNAPVIVTRDNSSTETTALPITVRSQVQVDLAKQMYFRQNMYFNGDLGTQVRVNVSGSQLGSTNAKGITSLAGPLTFSDDLSGMPAGTVLMNPGNCRNEPDPGWPSVTGSNPGVWTCSQSAPGAPVNITINGAQTDGGIGGVPGVPNSRTVFAGAFDLFIPAGSIGAGVDATDQLRGFDPVAVTGASNFGSASDASGWEPGGFTTDTCESPADNNNCATLPLSQVTGGGQSIYKDIRNGDLSAMFTDYDGVQLAVPGQSLMSRLIYWNTSGDTPNNVALCDTFDPAQQQISTSTATTVVQTSGTDPVPSYTIEYSASTEEGCGTAGDSATDGPWYSSIAAAGGASSVTKVRVSFVGPMPQLILEVRVPTTNIATAPGTIVQDALWAGADSAPLAFRDAKSFKVTGNIVQVRKLVNGDAAGQALAGDVVPFTIEPIVSYPAPNPPAVPVQIVDQMPGCYTNPEFSAQTLANWNVTIEPGDPGPDTFVCTADDVSGIRLVFDSKTPLTPNVAQTPIAYTIRVNNNTDDNVQLPNTARISAPGNTQHEVTRMSNAWLSIRTAAEVDVAKFVDAPIVEVSDQIGFTVQWSNTMGQRVGETKWIDKLPYVGDGRGTSFAGTATLSALQLHEGVNDHTLVEYTNRPPGLIDPDPYATSNEPGGDTVWCSSFGGAGCPATIAETTAVRITVPSFEAGQVGSIHYTMQPVGNNEGDVYQNYTSPGTAEKLPEPVPTSNQVRVDVVGSSVGELVWYDTNKDGVKDAGEAGIPNVVVNLLDSNGNVIDTATTDSNGLYRFSDYHSGDYRVVVDTSTLPFPGVIQPTYDLDNGTTNPNSDSGQFPLAFDTDRDDVNFGYVLPDGTDAGQFFSTQISQTSVAVNGSVSDMVTFTGDARPGTYTWKLLGPVADNAGSCVGLDWSGALADPLASNTFTVSGPGPVPTTPVALPSPGCYTYTGSYTMTGFGAPITDVPGLPSETALVSLSTPSVGTVASTTSNKPGADATDQITISGLTSDTTYTWTLLGPIDPGAGTCAAVDWTGITQPVANSKTIDVTPGQSVYVTEPTTVDDVGCYTYTGLLNSSNTTTAVPLAGGVPAESFEISANAPTVTTVASQNVTGPLATIHDTVTISGLGDQNALYSWTLLGPVPAIAGSCSTVDWTLPGIQVWDFENDVPVDGDGVHQMGDTVLGNAGCYTFTGSLAATATSDAATLAPGVPDETILVEATNPDISTVASQNSGKPGASVFDSVTIEGLGDNDSTYNWTLLGPVPAVAGSCEAVDWTNADERDSGHFDVTGDDTYETSPATTLNEVGCYTYTGTLEATGATNTASQAAGDPAETILITANTPSVTTAASQNTASPDDSVRDSVTVTGLGTETPNYHWSLLGPVPSVAGACDAVDWTNAPVFDFGDETANNGQFFTDYSDLGGAGCYTYVGTLASTATSDAFTQAPGDPAETILVGALNPDVTTEATENVAAPQASVRDAVTIVGLGDRTATYTWSLLGPVPAVAGSCDAVDWTGVEPFDTDFFTVTGDDTYLTDPTVLTSIGCYTYIGTLGATDASAQVDLAAGVPEETVLVEANVPFVSTQASTNTASPGAPVSDFVFVTGLGGESTTYSWSLLGPVPAINGSCAAVDWTTADVLNGDSLPVSGNGPYETGATTLDAAGCYTFTGTLAPTATSEGATLSAGVAEETVLVAENTPTIATVASANAGMPGDIVHDTVTISGIGSAASTYTWSLLGPVSPVNGSCAAVVWAGADVLATDDIDIDGDDVYQTPDVSLDLPGCYTYAGSIAATPSSGFAAQAPGVPAETVLVSPNQGAATTAISDTTTTSGDTVFDAITVTGLDGETVSYHWSLLGPVPAVNGSCDAVDWSSAQIVDEDTLDVNGNGPYQTPEVQLVDAGCYTYTGELGSSATSLGATLAAGDPAETTLLAPASAVISTVVSPQTGQPGTTVHDTVTITGAVPAGTVYTWTLYGPLAAAAGSCDALDWTGAEVEATDTVDVTGPGPFQTPDVTLNEVGCFSYGGSLEASASTTAAEQAPGVPAETLQISANAAGAVTAISDTTTTAGDIVYDAITVSGLGAESTVYSWSLLGPVAPVNNACLAVDWTGAPEVDADTISVTGNGLYETPQQQLFDAGCYTYTGHLAATATSTEVTLAAGDPAETTLLAPAVPGLTTQASPQTGKPGLAVTDSVVLTGPIADGTLYTWTLYGPVAAVNNACDAVDWTGAPVVASDDLVIDGPGTYPTPEQALNEVGCYTYGGSLAASTSTTEAVQAPGDPAETMRVSPNLPSVTTTASESAGLPGDTFSDSVVISGTDGAQTSYDWTLLGPVPAVDESCAAVDWTDAAELATGSFDVDGDNTYTTGDTVVDEVGCYTYTGSLAASDTTDPVELGAGDPAETFLIDAFAPTVVTEASASTGQPGDTFSDSIVVSTSGGVTTTYTWALLRADFTGAGSCDAVDWNADGTQVDTGTLTINGDDTYVSGETKVIVAGCYTYTGELAGTDTSDAVSLAAGDPAESFQVNAFVPVVVTEANASGTEPGDAVSDGITVSNFGLDAVAYDWTLLGPVDAIDGSCEAVSWAGAAVFDSGTLTVIPGTSTYITTSSEAGLPGCYTYTGALDSSNSSEAVTLEAGDPAETFIVTPLVPEVSTHVSSSQTYIDDKLSDTVVITGTRGAEVDATWQLVGPVQPTAGASCDTVDWTDAPVAYEGTFVAEGDGTFETPEVTLKFIGCYSYVTILEGTATTAAVTHEVGDPDETTHTSVRPTGLALTGTTVLPVLGIGVLVLGLGVVAVIVTRRRRTGRHSTTS